MDEPTTTTTSNKINSSDIGKMMTTVGSSSSHNSYFFNNTYDDDIPDEVWFEILLRLPLKSIFKFSSVSKQWLSVISNPLFRTTRINMMSASTTPLPWILYFQFDSLEDQLCSKPLPLPDVFSTIQSISIEAENDNCSYGFSFSFLTEQEKFTYKPRKRVHLLASSNGLVLCSTRKYEPKDYIVCNPLTKEWVFLPQPKSIGNEFEQHTYLHGFICEPSSSSTSFVNSTVYKVIRICLSLFVPDFKVEIYSSNSCEWNTYEFSCPEGAYLCHGHTIKGIMHSNGVFYWTGGQGRVVAHDLKNNNTDDGTSECTPYNVDIPIPLQRWRRRDFCNPCIGESEGLLCYCEIYNDRTTETKTLSVWKLDRDECSWSLVHKIDLKDIIIEVADPRLLLEVQMLKVQILYRGFCEIHPLAFNPMDRNIVILGWHTCIATYNIRTRRLKVLRSLPFQNKGPSLGTQSCWSCNALPYVLPLWPTTTEPLSPYR